MSQPPSSRKQGRNRRRRPRAAELWRPVAEAEVPEPITTTDDPATMLRSLGDPPLQAHSVSAGHYLAAVVDRAAGLAVALAAAADLLADGHADEGSGDGADGRDDVRSAGADGAGGDATD